MRAHHNTEICAIYLESRIRALTADLERDYGASQFAPTIASDDISAMKRDMFEPILTWTSSLAHHDDVQRQIYAFQYAIEDTCALCARTMQSDDQPLRGCAHTSCVADDQHQECCIRAHGMNISAWSLILCAKILDTIYDAMFYSDVDGFEPLFRATLISSIGNNICDDICAYTWASCIYTIVVELERKPWIRDMLSKGDRYIMDQVFDLYATHYREQNIEAVTRARATLIGFIAYFEPCATMPKCDTVTILRAVSVFNETIFTTVLDQMRAQIRLLEQLREYQMRWCNMQKAQWFAVREFNVQPSALHTHPRPQEDCATQGNSSAHGAFYDPECAEIHVCSAICARDFVRFLEDHLRCF